MQNIQLVTALFRVNNVCAWVARSTSTSGSGRSWRYRYRPSCCWWSWRPSYRTSVVSTSNMHCQSSARSRSVSRHPEYRPWRHWAATSSTEWCSGSSHSSSSWPWRVWWQNATCKLLITVGHVALLQWFHYIRLDQWQPCCGKVYGLL